MLKYYPVTVSIVKYGPFTTNADLDVDDHRAQRLALRRLGVDVEVILTPPCIICMENH
jgi:hypothetical protein